MADGVEPPPFVDDELKDDDDLFADAKEVRILFLAQSVSFMIMFINDTSEIWLILLALNVDVPNVKSQCGHKESITNSNIFFTSRMCSIQKEYQGYTR